MEKKALIFVATFIISFLSISLLTFSPYDPFLLTRDSDIEIMNWLGQPGAFIAHPIFTLFGQASYFIVLAMVLIYLSFLIKIYNNKRFKWIMGFFLGIFGLSYSIVVFTGDPSFKGGGIVAGIVHTLVTKGFGLFGELGFGLSLIAGSLYLIFDSPKTYIDQLYDKVLLLKKVLNDWLAGWTQGRGDRLPFIQKVSVPKTNNGLSDHGSPNPVKESNESMKKSMDKELENPVSVRHKSEQPGDPFPEPEIIYLSPDNESFISLDLSSEKETEPVLFDHKVQDTCVNEYDSHIDKPILQENPCTDLKGHGLTTILQSWKNLKDEEAKQQEYIKLKKLSHLQELVEMTAYKPSLPSLSIEIGENNAIEPVSEISPSPSDRIKVIDEDSEPLPFQENILSSPVNPKYADSHEDLSIHFMKPLPDLRVHHLPDSIVQSFMDSSSEQINDTTDHPLAFSTLMDHIEIKAGFSGLDLSQSEPEAVRSDEYETASKLQSTLQEFAIKAEVLHVARGPVITRYEILPAAGIKVSKIVGLQDNIALALAASKIRIVAPIPGKSAVGIEIPNKQRSTVTFGDLITSPEFQKQEYHLPIALGKGISGQTMIEDLVTMPHLLIAGATGSGKSVFVNTLICSLLFSTTPSEARFIMIDPKRVELKMYDEIPYLLAPVITEPKKAVIALKWAVNEMEERYRMLEAYSCRDIRSFNKKVIEMKAKDMAVDPPMAYIIIIIDEFADLMMVCGKEVEEQVSRLAAMSRAVGIHLVLATQRPSVDVITGLIKANFPARVAFQVSSKTESRIILDTNGADKLLGKGDLLFTAPGMGNLLRIQGAYLSDDEVNEITSYLKSQGKPNYEKELEMIEVEGDESSGGQPGDEPLFREAVEIILADRKASASYLQRRMRIGYNRAARIIELLEDKGIVSPAIGSKPREILIDSYLP